MKQGTQSQGAGTTQRDGTGREVGGGLWMGDTYTPFMSMYGKKPPQYCKVISLQLKQINKLKKIFGRFRFGLRLTFTDTAPGNQSAWEEKERLSLES